MREFTSFGGMARHLVEIAAQGEAASSAVAKWSAHVIQEDAQDRIGVYQEQTGPYAAWAPLAESTVMDRIHQGFSPLEPLLRTGGLRDSITTSLDRDLAVVGSPDPVLLYQEEGTPTIPPRAVLGPAAFESKDKIGHLAATLIVAWLCGMRWEGLQSKKLP